MKLEVPFPSLRRSVAIAFTVGMLGLPAVSRAVEATNETGVRLLEAELLPAKVTLLGAKCAPLVVAVGKATLAHPRDALVILDAALSRRVRKLHDKLAALPCTCARRIFLASIAASPKRSSDLLDLAMELYPDCTPEFAAALRDFESGSLAGRDGNGSPGSTGMGSPMGGSMSNPTDPDVGDGGFGVGFGPGFPGSPGFAGSGPGVGLALPPVVVTTVVNG